MICGLIGPEMSTTVIDVIFSHKMNSSFPQRLFWFSMDNINSNNNITLVLIINKFLRWYRLTVRKIMFQFIQQFPSVHLYCHLRLFSVTNTETEPTVEFSLQWQWNRYSVPQNVFLFKVISKVDSTQTLKLEYCVLSSSL